MITLESIEAKQTEISEMLSAFKAQVNEPRTFEISAQCIVLELGEKYAGIILGKDGQPDLHLILLPGEAANVSWADAKKFASEAGGELPARREQALLYANLKEAFQAEAYWSGEQHASTSACAWCQYFRNGTQYDRNTTDKLRARAVRRLPLSNSVI